VDVVEVVAGVLGAYCLGDDPGRYWSAVTLGFVVVVNGPFQNVGSEALDILELCECVCVVALGNVEVSLYGWPPTVAVFPYAGDSAWS
jgi:hypothetical protein